jgi:hypothetical protein|tara:strand:+ start:2283 stop:2480 length:198 start_codon:yes stop_codon:yes gene_type:complete
MLNKNLVKLNRKLRDTITEERFNDRIEELIKEGLVKIVGCEDDGTPIVNITKKGMNMYTSELGDA